VDTRIGPVGRAADVPQQMVKGRVRHGSASGGESYSFYKSRPRPGPT
jgi:hypothetical protein